MQNPMFLYLLTALCSLPVFGTEPPPNVIIFIADDVSWNDFGCYGNHQVQTPHIDQLAENGIVFFNTYLTASSCSPSRNSIMTGRYPHNTGAAELHTQPPESMVSFPEILRSHGYYTAMSGKFHMGDYANRGFEDIIVDLDLVGNGGQEMWVSQVENRPMDQPFFMWFAAYDAHRPWGPNVFTGTHDSDALQVPPYLADGPLSREDLAQYYDEIFRFDHYIGEVVEVLRQQNVLDETLILVMSDNGRAFPHSKTRVNDRGMKTPFVLHWPTKVQQHHRSDSLISAIDIAPTILELAGIEIPEFMQGSPFSVLIEDPASPFRNYVFAEHNWHDYEAHQRMVRDRNFMYILNSRPEFAQLGPADALSSPSYLELVALKESGSLSAVQSDVFVTPRPREELYDLQSDPLQFVNVASMPEYQTTLGVMRQVMKRWMDETGDTVPESITKDWYLRQPGYIHSEHHGIRGETPGESRSATEIIHRGPF